VVHLPDVVVVLLEGCVPAVLHLLLAVHCGEDPGLVVVPAVGELRLRALVANEGGMQEEKKEQDRYAQRQLG
jgi:hypothetical protein